MHEHDAASAVASAMEHKLRGVFNVAGPNPVPLTLLCKTTGKPAIPMPEPLFDFVVGRAGFSQLPRGAINHVKYPIVVDSRPFWEATGFKPCYDEMTTMESFRWA
jgi:UDP-glucose 4-epimerase